MIYTYLSTRSLRLHSWVIDGALRIYSGKKTITGRFVGSMEETQEILEFWAAKGLETMGGGSEDGLCERGVRENGKELREV